MNEDQRLLFKVWSVITINTPVNNDPVWGIAQKIEDLLVEAGVWRQLEREYDYK